jgi:hypothetical protein
MIDNQKKRIWLSKLKSYFKLLQILIRSPSDFKWQMRCLRRWQESAPPEWVAQPEDFYFVLRDKKNQREKHAVITFYKIYGQHNASMPAARSFMSKSGAGWMDLCPMWRALRR